VANEDKQAYCSLTGPKFGLKPEVPVDTKELQIVIDKLLLDLSYAITPSDYESLWTDLDGMLYVLHYKLSYGYQLILDGQFNNGYLRILSNIIKGSLLRVSTLPNWKHLASHINLARECLFQLADTLQGREENDIIFESLSSQGSDETDIIFESQASHPHCPVRQTDEQSAPRVEKKFVLRTSGESTKLPSRVSWQDSTKFDSFSPSKIPDDSTYQSHLKEIKESIANRSRPQFGADPQMIARQDLGFDSRLQEVSSLAPTSSPYARQEIVSTGMESVEEVDDEA